jgi:hypothetical protein
VAPLDSTLPRSNTSSLTSLPTASGPLRKRRRQRIIPEVEVETETNLEGSQSGGGNSESFDLVLGSLQELSRSRLTVVQLAIRLLEEKYTGRFNEEHMDKAMELLENEAKASVFTATQDKARRDRWLCHNAMIKFLSEESEENA